MNEERVKQIKIALLRELAEQGTNPEEIGRALRDQFQTKRAALSLGDLMKGFGSSIKGLAIGGAVLGLGGYHVGRTGGRFVENITGPRESDVEYEREKERLDKLRRAAMRVENELASQNARLKEDRTRAYRPKFELTSVV